MGLWVQILYKKENTCILLFLIYKLVSPALSAEKTFLVKVKRNSAKNN